LSGSITFLIDAPGTTLDGGTRGLYNVAITNFSLSPAFNHYEGAHNSGSITVDNNHPNDGITFNSSQGELIWSLVLQQNGAMPPLFDSVGIPITPPDLASLDIATFTYRDLDLEMFYHAGRLYRATHIPDGTAVPGRPR
jgi:hypothetical protein